MNKKQDQKHSVYHFCFSFLFGFLSRYCFELIKAEQGKKQEVRARLIESIEVAEIIVGCRKGWSPLMDPE